MRYTFSKDNLSIRKQLDRNLSPVEGDHWTLVYDESFCLSDTTEDDITIIFSGSKYDCRSIMHFCLQLAHSIDPDTFKAVSDFFTWNYVRDLDIQERKEELGDSYIERRA